LTQVGVLIFNYIKLKDVITKLERYYDVKIQCANKKLQDKIFTARFENVSIEHVLLSFKGIYPIDYKIKNNQVILTNKHKTNLNLCNYYKKPNQYKSFYKKRNGTYLI